ncbi:hypothetical protein K488DRAFT_52337 [Vararia minispora EC-137]|uniref:Uncharacterized protein n=1 Tax=Vararia minispora EC-137 TaxID=1314806 RepID=A0ACB8QHP8_9AGAM|nr:hypothetical protein K488DRAFT_52337 [Vararia minispora EC-137]
MRDFNVYSVKKALPRMSWNPTNLFNLWRRQVGSLKDEAVFTRSNKTLFQQRWLSKKLLRAYHGDFVNEKAFKRWYLPRMLPDVRPVRPLVYKDEIGTFAGNAKTTDAQDKLRREAEDGKETELAPVGSLMLTEIERRLDVLIHRACLASSVYDARRFIVHGYVYLNGIKHQDANTRLAPGDMVSVDPVMIRWLHRTGRDRSEAAPAFKPKTEEFETKLPHGLYLAKIHGGGRRHRGMRWSNTCNLPEWCSPFLFIPAYLEVSFQTCSFVYVRHPTARPSYSEIPTPFDADGEIVRLAWEWYAKRRPRMRSASQRAREPLNRQ